MKKIGNKIIQSKKIRSYLIIVIVTLFVSIPLWNESMNIAGDDGIQHISRLIGTAQAVQGDSIFPVIMSDFCNGFGYSWNLFYSPLTAYLPLLFRLITSSYILMLKIFMVSVLFFSGVSMYHFVYEITKRHRASCLAAIIYLTAPYHLTDCFSRIAIAELTSFIFLPLVFLGLYYIVNEKRKKGWILSIGAIGLLLTHNVITVYTAIFSIIYLIINVKKIWNKETMRHLCLNAILILLTTSFYWFPLLEHKNATDYQVFMPETMVTDQKIQINKLKWEDYFLKKGDKLIFHLGLPVILGIAIFSIVYPKQKKEEKKLLITFFIFGIISIYMSSVWFPFEKLPEFLKLLQFPWRMLEFSSFFLSIVSGIVLEEYIRKSFLLKASFILYTTILLMSFKTTTDQAINEKVLIPSVPITQHTGRVHANCATFEYLPTKAYENIPYIVDRSSHAEVLRGTAKLEESKKHNTSLGIKIETANEDVILELPYIYYLGYEVIFTEYDQTNLLQENREKIKLEITESEHGFCQVTVPKNKVGMLGIKYTGTTGMKITLVLSLMGMGILLGYCIKDRKKDKGEVNLKN